MRRDVAAYRALRAQVLSEEPYCVGWPMGFHQGERVPTTSLDHVIPLVQGGAHTRANTRGLCSKCNSRKGQSERARPRSWRDG